MAGQTDLERDPVHEVIAITRETLGHLGDAAMHAGNTVRHGWNATPHMARAAIKREELHPDGQEHAANAKESASRLGESALRALPGVIFLGALTAEAIHLLRKHNEDDAEAHAVEVVDSLPPASEA